ncbi:MAG: VgrG-related protein [Chloroflexota bacterium]|nr:VgrG-related protein [Chloroflexota bacterium]
MPREPELISQVYLRIDGSDVSDDVMANLISVEVDDNLNLPDTFTIHVRDPRLEWVDSDTFSLGKSVEISARNGSRAMKLIEGEITAVEPRISRDALPTLTVRGYDKCHRLHREKKTCSFNQVTDSDIATSIARQVGMRANVDTTREVYDYVVQDNQTDWEFLWERANGIGFRVFVEGDELNFRRAPETTEVPTLEWGDNLIEFHPRLNSSEQVGEVIVRGWDPVEKQEIVGRASRPEDTPETGIREQGGESAERAFGVAGREVIQDRPVATQAEADALAQAICNEIGHSFISAEGVCTGSPAVQAGAVVELRNVGNRFGGRYRVNHALHRYDAEGFSTEFTIGGRRGNTLAELLVPRREGHRSPMIGQVTDTSDPQDLGRVRVRLPSRGGQELGWARYVSPGGGADRGFMWLPEVGDEVLVVFEHEDIRRPFVVGGLWNSEDHPPASSQTCVNGQGSTVWRGLQSRTGMKLIISEESGEERIGIYSSDDGFYVRISECDNKVEIRSRGDVSIEADGSIKIEGAQVEMKSNGSLKIDGGTVEITGSQIKLN